MKLVRKRKNLRGWLSPAGMAFVAAFAMLLQPFCAPACAAKHCAATTSSKLATHCGGGAEQQDDALTAPRQICSSTEALPAILGEAMDRTDPGDRSHPRDPLSASFSEYYSRLLDASALADRLEAGTDLLPRASSSSLFPVLRV